MSLSTYVLGILTALLASRYQASVAEVVRWSCGAYIMCPISTTRLVVSMRSKESHPRS